jgi:uncharacterized protein YeeX (DUF496 family)
MDGTVFNNVNHTSTVRKLEKKLKREQRALARKLENNKKRGENLLLKVEEISPKMCSECKSSIAAWPIFAPLIGPM